MSVFFSTQLSEVTEKLWNPAECTAALAHSDVHTSWGQITAGKRVQFRVKPELVLLCREDLTLERWRLHTQTGNCEDGGWGVSTEQLGSALWFGGVCLFFLLWACFTAGFHRESRNMSFRATGEFDLTHECVSMVIGWWLGAGNNVILWPPCYRSHLVILFYVQFQK